MGQWSQQEVETLKKNMEDYLKVGEVRLENHKTWYWIFPLPFGISLFSVVYIFYSTEAYIAAFMCSFILFRKMD